MTVVTGETTKLTLYGAFAQETFDVVITDHDVFEAIKRYPSVGEAVDALLKVGACAVLAASTGFDVQAIRRELERAVEDATRSVGDLKGHVSGVVGEDGPLAQTMRFVTKEMVDLVSQALASHADADTPGTLISKVQLAGTRLDDLLMKARQDIAEEVQRLFAQHAEHTGKTLLAMRELDPASALGQAVARMEKQLAELDKSVAAAQATAAERLRGTAKGADYEDNVTEVVAGIAAVYGDHAERTGAQQGLLLSNKRPSFRGDVTCTVGEGLRIVIEAMDREAGQLTSRAVQAELEEAMQNRGAQAAVAVMSAAENTLLNRQPLQMLAPNMFAVVLDRDGSQVLALQVAYRLARHIVMTKAERNELVDVVSIQRCVDQVSAKLTGLADVKTQLGNVARGQEAALAALVRFEREMREAVAAVVDMLSGASQEAA